MSAEPGMDPGDAAAALDAADASRVALAQQRRLPRGHHALTVVAVAVFLMGSGIQAAYTLDNRLDELAFYIMVCVSVGLELWRQRRFKALNGMWVEERWGRRGTAPANVTRGLAFSLAFFGVLTTSHSGDWWLTTLIALAGGGAQALISVWWWRLYRTDQGASAA